VPDDHETAADPSGVGPLAGWTVGVTAERRREELGEALRRRGAGVVYGPAIRVVPLEDDTEARAATERCLERPLDLVVATTGVGFRGWLAAAEAWGLAGRLHEALAAATILARGPKVRGAVRADDLREAWSPESESSAEVQQHLLDSYELAGRRVAIQLHGDPLTAMVDALRAAGAEVTTVPVYRWEPPADPAPLHRLIAAVAAGEVDAVTFTSAPAATNFLRTADELGHGDAVRTALRGPVLAAAVGSVTAGPLDAAGIPSAQPERFRLGALVRTVADELPRRAVGLVAAGHRLELRGRAVLVDDVLVPLAADELALLRALVAGAVVAAGTDVVTRLRATLGDPALVVTVEGGHRLAGA
jgi:uroporphyrinogen-III synthase